MNSIQNYVINYKIASSCSFSSPHFKANNINNIKKLSEETINNVETDLKLSRVRRAIINSKLQELKSRYQTKIEFYKLKLLTAKQEDRINLEKTIEKYKNSIENIDTALTI